MNTKKKQMNSQTKPDWLKKKIDLASNVNIKSKLSKFKLHTICEEALCPNITECFKKGVATFLILGDICTRTCMFCGVNKGRPVKPDENEPENVALMIKNLGLKHVVITSVTRDDLDDRGSGQFIKTIKSIRNHNKNTKIEVLIPDFDADENLIKKIINAKPDIIAHNIETIKNIYPLVGRHKDRYNISLDVLSVINKTDKNIITKSGLMLGLGENNDEILEVLNDILKTGCAFLSIGQYLAPSKNHYPVQEYINPVKFKQYEKTAYQLGFKKVKSGPFVRSSYLADEYFD